MRSAVHLLLILLILSAVSRPARAQATQVYNSDIGFSFALPAGWEVVDMKPSLPAMKQDLEKSAASNDEKQGIGCSQLDLTARHGNPASVVVVLDLPFACFGREMTDKDLLAFGAGASEGLKETFNISDPVQAVYSHGSHLMWIERAKGTPKAKPETQYTVETVCSLLKKGAVCWMAMIVDNSALEIFEQSPVGLDSDAPSALVPANAFDKKPS